MSPPREPVVVNFLLRSVTEIRKKTRRLGGVALSHNSIIPAISYLRSTLIHANSDIGVRLAL